MKKLLGISLVAVLAVSPMMASAARDASVAVANYNFNGQVSTDVATTSYVKGAYESASDRIDALVTDTTVTGESHNYIANTGSVAENLTALDVAIKGIANQAGDYVTHTEGTATPVSGKTLQYVSADGQAVGANLGVLDNQVKINAEAISDETQARQTADTTLQQNIDAEETRATGVEADLQDQIDSLSGNMTGNFATQTGVAATVNAATATGTVQIAQTWGSDTTIPHTITSDVAVNGYVPGTGNGSGSGTGNGGESAGESSGN